MLLSLCESLPSLVKAKFTAAKASSSLSFSPTELAIIPTTGRIPFQLRYCPTLAKKPEPKKAQDVPKQKVDPFENPTPDLHVIDIPTTTNPTHVLVLNKFPIIAEHFILATKSNKKQTHLLEQDDLEATYACLKAWQDGPDDKQRQLFAFFNSGEHSGASQPRRHLQFLPVENMRGDGEGFGDWNLLVDGVLAGRKGEGKDSKNEPFQHKDMPIAHFAMSFDSEPSGSQLSSIYNQLHSQAKHAVDDFIAANPQQLSLHSTDGGDSPISYNLAMTTAGMMIVPRRAEGTMLRGEDGSDVGFVALNGTTLGGTLMVKYSKEWDLLRKKPEILDEILVAIGIPRERSWSKSRV